MAWLMNNAEMFEKTFHGLTATELWCMEEEDFLKWLNADYEQLEDICGVTNLPCSDCSPCCEHRKTKG